MMKDLWTVLLVSAGAIGFLQSKAGLAHHSFAAHYDLDREITFDGIVTDYRFINPHVLILLETTTGDGRVEEWIAEAGSPTLYRRMNMGLQRDSLSAGDAISVAGYPSRFNENDVHLTRLVFPDGSEMTFENAQAAGR